LPPRRGRFRSPQNSAQLLGNLTYQTGVNGEGETRGSTLLLWENKKYWVNLIFIKKEEIERGF
jgi:hypothetical protein